jgi:hypothetical protein
MFMKTRTQLATTLLALASLPLLAQQQPRADQPPDTQPTQQNPSSPQQYPSSSRQSPMPDRQAASPGAATANEELIPVNGELVSKLDSKTAKTGDSVVVQTKTSVKTPAGAEIPKGSKLVGHVIGVQPSEAGQTSQVAVLLDHVELQGGQSMPVHSQIQSIAPAGGADSSGGSRAMSAPSAGSSSNPSPGSTANNTPQGTAGAPQAAPAENASPAPGTIVAKTGNIDIRTTSVPGVMLANNAPGQQDPRMARASSILLGAKQDVQLDTGTQMVIGLSASAAGPQ